jgi:hypothetical protein
VSLSTEIHGQLVESDALMAHHDLFFPKWDGTKSSQEKEKEKEKNNFFKVGISLFQFFLYTVLLFFASFYALTLRPAIVDRLGHNGGHGELSRATI